MTHTNTRKGRFKHSHIGTQWMTNGIDKETDFTLKHTRQAARNNKTNNKT